MKIYRDGQEIELTGTEVYHAYLEQQHEFDMADCDYILNDGFDEDVELLTQEQLDGIAKEYRRLLDNGDPDWMADFRTEQAHHAKEFYMSQKEAHS